MVEHTGIDFVQMDGLGGFLFAADKIGALLLAKKLKVDDGRLVWHTIDKFGEEQVLSALRHAGETNPRIEAYRLVAEAHRKEQNDYIRESEEIRSLTYADLKRKLPELRGYWLTKWGEHACPEDLELAARDLLAAQTSQEQLDYLRIFTRRPFPLDRTRLFQLAESDDENLSLWASRARANITHPSVRELASRLIETRRAGREEAIGILNRNWNSGDHEIALGWFEREEDRDTRHRLGIDLRKLWESHPDPASEVRMLLTLYEKGPCSECREYLLARLIDLGSLPESIRKECAYDANERIRQLVAADRPESLIC